MTIEKFKEFINPIFPDSDAAAQSWYEWAEYLEECDSSGGEIPAGSYKTAETFLDEFAQKIAGIREQYGDDVAGKVVSLPVTGAAPFPWEMKRAAEHLAAGGSVCDIIDMEKSGELEDFSDIVQEDGQGQQDRRGRFPAVLGPL